MMRLQSFICVLFILACASLAISAGEDEKPNHRPPKNDADLKYWLQNMAWHHRFSDEEITKATGLKKERIRAALKRFNITPQNRPKIKKDTPLRVLPYPGGRHPRIGFLDGAVRPQRETKLSVFTPWDDKSYVVVDLPEAIWSNLGLTYLAHTHVPTVWTKKNVELKKLEWNRRADGSFDLQRTLPNGIAYTAKAKPTKDALQMELSLTNGTKQKLTDLRVQICVLLARAAGFEQQDNDNKKFLDPYVACHDKTGKRWIITAWQSFHRGWGNKRCPCIHSDPKFADCAPGETRRIQGWLSFYEGDDVAGEVRRIEGLGWRNEK